MAPSILSTQAFLSKSDGKDKLLATCQYISMFISAGDPGVAKKVQVSLVAARKVFRIFKPLESLVPLYTNPSLDWRKPMHIEVLKKLKCILMAVYFGGDHVVWLKQAGLVERDVSGFQKLSLYGWFGGSLCTIVSEVYELQSMTKRKYGESDEAYVARQKEVEKAMRAKALVLVHAVFQALLALGLIRGLSPDASKRWRPRTVGLFGIAASALNCYMLYPTPPPSIAPRDEKTKKT